MTVAAMPTVMSIFEETVAGNEEPIRSSWWLDPFDVKNIFNKLPKGWVLEFLRRREVYSTC